jgi:hypothetical protein
MPDILNCNDSPKGERLTSEECSEIYNALADRIHTLRADLDVLGVPKRTAEALADSLERCEKLVEVFE